MSELDEDSPKRPKTGGRQKGTPNRATAEVRQAFADLVQGNLDNVKVWLDRVARDNPAKAVELILQLSRYILPELKAMAIDVQTEPRDVRRMTIAELERSILEDMERERLPAPVEKQGDGENE